MTDNTRAHLPAPKDLNASSALIVGGTAGIGLASARALAAAGVPRIVVVGRNADRGWPRSRSPNWVRKRTSSPVTPPIPPPRPPSRRRRIGSCRESTF